LQPQLEVKDKQIMELTATVKMQAESINADRNNELVETIIGGHKKLLDDKTPIKKRWQFWKKSK